jgi:guanidinopropionase
VQHIEAYYKRLDEAGVRPVSIGGDHSITGPILKAISGPNAKLTGGKKVALVHFDAHTDAYDHIPHWLGSVRSAAHWAAYLVAEGHVDASKSVQVGIRGNVVTLDWRKSSDRMGYRVISIDEYREIGIQKTIETIVERVGDSPIYITFDVDCLDPSVAPAAANLEPGYDGFTSSEVIKIMQGLKGKNVIGADIVCIIPTKDSPNNITTLTAMVIMFEQLCLIAEYLRGKKK